MYWPDVVHLVQPAQVITSNSMNRVTEKRRSPETLIREACMDTTKITGAVGRVLRENIRLTGSKDVALQVPACACVFRAHFGCVKDQFC
jgi:hypothetical protein